MEVDTMLRGRRSATALADATRERGSDIAGSLGSTAGEMGTRAAEAVSDLVDKAAEALSDAAEQAAEVLADTSEQISRKIRPRRRRGRRVGIVLLLAVLVGGGAGIWMSPLGARLRALLGMGGEPTDTAAEPASILLPGDATPSPAETATAAADGANGDRELSGRTRGSAKTSS
jgi:hypothetical protein